VVSELDKALAALEARRAQEEADRQNRRNLACDFLRSFHENDVKPSTRLKARGIEASFAGPPCLVGKAGLSGEDREV
jgi:hypothetical protein